MSTIIEKKDYVEVAKHMMELIQVDNGYHHVEGISFPKKWVNLIAKECEIFFSDNDELLNDEDIENICLGGDDISDQYLKIKGFDRLDKALNDYFDNGMGTGMVEIKPRILSTYRKIKK